MSIESSIIALAQAIGADIKTLTTNQGSLSSLTTTAKASLVAALNELKTAVDAAAGAAGIDDETTGVATTWSSTKISDQIAAAVSDLIASAPAALDTLNELATALGNDPNYATTVATALGNRVRYDASQTLTLGQQQQACANIGIGDPDHNFVTDYTTAKA